MSKRIRVGNTTYVVPDDATDDEITQIVDSQATAAPPPVPKPASPNMEMSVLGAVRDPLTYLRNGRPKPEHMEMPGSFEGHPENLGEPTEAYLKGSVGNVAGGAKDIYQGNVARGIHRGIKGVGIAASPLLIPAAVTAPGATALALGGGYLGSKVAGGTAQALGATPDQQDLAGDIGGIVGGGVGVKAPEIATSIARKVLPRVATAVDPDITGLISPRLAHLQRVSGKLSKIAATPEAVEANPQLSEPLSPAAEHLQNRIQIERGLREQEPFPRQSEGLPEVEEGQAAATEHLQNAVQPREASNFRMEQTPRRFSGEVSPEIPGRVSTYDFVGERASPIPPREGLMLSGEVEPPKIALPPKQLPAAFNPLPRTPKMPPVVGTVDMPFKTAEPSTPIATKPITSAHVGGLLDEGLGAKSLERNVPLRQQLDRVTPVAPKESSVVKSHSYDPETREMTVTTQNGQTYVHGDVTPEQAQAFSQADSKGKAWNNLRGSSTLVAKVVNGKRVPIKPAGPRIATPQDLTPVLQESVRIAKSQKK